jgi:phosphatidylinositol glycan class U
MPAKISTTLAVGILIRLILFNITSLREWLEDRVEISTPLTGWNRVLEGIYLKKTLNISPYESDLIHEIPVMLKFYTIITNLLGQRLINYFFVFIDVLNGLLLYKISEKILSYLELLEINEFKMGKYELFKIKYSENRTNEELELEKGEMLKKSTRFLISSFNNTYLSLITLIFYCLSPYVLANCVAKSTSVINNFILCVWLVLLLSDRVGLSLIFLALISHNSVYPIMLVVPSLLYVWNTTTVKGSKELIVLKYLFYFCVYLSAIFAANYYLEDYNLKFIKSTYLFILKVPDLQPNLGLFWYFFTEIFDHFREFFTWVFQLNMFIYLIPLTIRLRNNPIILIYILIGLISVLKSYPCLGDAGLYISLLPTFKYLFKFMRNLLIYSCMFVISTILAPIMWHLWIHTGSGNANFYFAITLVYSISQIFLVVDILYAYLKREYIKFKGDKIPKLENGDLANFSIE